MGDKYIPEWATEKQKEGMRKFYNLMLEYRIFHELEFKKYTESDSDEHHQFFAIIKKDSGLTEHKFRIGFNYEQTWDCYGDKIFDWQFIFADGDATRELSSEIYNLDLFFAADKKIEQLQSELANKETDLQVARNSHGHTKNMLNVEESRTEQLKKELTALREADEKLRRVYNLQHNKLLYYRRNCNTARRQLGLSKLVYKKRID